MDPAALEAARRAKEAEELPPLPPLLQAILERTRAKQAAVREGRPAPEEEQEGSPGGARARPGGPLLLEGPEHQAGLLVVGTGVPERRPGDSDSELSEDERPDADAPPGPLDPARCRVHGPGFGGGAAGQVVKLTLTARDAAGKRIREGGAHVLVLVEPPAGGAASASDDEPEPIQAEVQDHGDGTYSATYAVPAKGTYQARRRGPRPPAGARPALPLACGCWPAARRLLRAPPACRRRHGLTGPAPHLPRPPAAAH